jgi:integrase
MSQTGARVSEAVRLLWAQVDLEGRTALLLKTKTRVNSQRCLTDELVTRLRRLPDEAAADDHLFRYTCQHSVNERTKAVCARAEISHKSSHACGQHSFATNATDIKSTMQA